MLGCVPKRIKPVFSYNNIVFWNFYLFLETKQSQGGEGGDPRECGWTSSRRRSSPTRRRGPGPWDSPDPEDGSSSSPPWKRPYGEGMRSCWRRVGEFISAKSQQVDANQDHDQDHSPAGSSPGGSPSSYCTRTSTPSGTPAGGPDSPVGLPGRPPDQVQLPDGSGTLATISPPTWSAFPWTRYGGPGRSDGATRWGVRGLVHDGQL